MTMPGVLLDDRFYPVTAEVGVVAAGPEAVASALADWLTETQRDKRWRADPAPASSLEAALGALVPLQRVMPSRYLVVPAKGWSVLFVNSWRVSALAGEVGAVVGRAGVPGFVAGYTTDQPRVGRSGLRRYAHCRLEVFEPVGGRRFGVPRRRVEVLHDGDRWRFASAGDPLPCEDVTRYGHRVVSRRFGAEQLEACCAFLGLDPFDETAYQPSAAVLVSRLDPFANDEDVSLAEAQGVPTT
jgi:hypothetical protein